MLTFRLLLAAVADPTPELPIGPPTNVVTAHLRDILLVTGAALVLASALFLYVYMTRRGRQGRTHSGSRAIYRAERRDAQGDDSGKHKLRKKRRRSEEFSNRNPTLGETGGLPPLRTDEPVEPAP